MIVLHIHSTVTDKLDWGKVVSDYTSLNDHIRDRCLAITEYIMHLAFPGISILLILAIKYAYFADAIINQTVIVYVLAIFVYKLLDFAPPPVRSIRVTTKSAWFNLLQIFNLLQNCNNV